MTPDEKEDLIVRILLAISELKDAAVEENEDKQEMIWSDIEEHLNDLAYGEKD